MKDLQLENSVLHFTVTFPILTPVQHSDSLLAKKARLSKGTQNVTMRKRRDQENTT